MQLQTKVDICPSDRKIGPCEEVLFVGSCFAENIGKKFCEDKFQTLVNPYGVMYNPVSVLHTIDKVIAAGNYHFKTVVITLGTNHVYREITTDEIVDNCQKRPHNLFREEIMTVDECYDVLKEIFKKTKSLGSHLIITVSPIRYRKYGYHESQLSKATLLLAADRLIKDFAADSVEYFPSYEIVNDELRDYRFYKPDMLHPSDQAVDYIYERFSETYFSEDTNKFLNDWRPLKEALGHRPLNAESDEYKAFLQKTEQKLETLKLKYELLGFRV